MINRIKQKKPLILNITNYVTMDFVANGLLSLGASPVMSLALNEIDDLMKCANAIVINLGTLTDEFVSFCHSACQAANRHKKIIILDPVGAGATQYRTLTAQSLIDSHDIQIIRGNASEIMSIAHNTQSTKGVDSTVSTDIAIQSAVSLSKKVNSAIVISGAIDVIIDDNHIEHLHHGSQMMQMITGTGCLMSAVIATFAAIEENRFLASVEAARFYGLCGEIAEKKSQGPGSFRMHFLDALHNLNNDDKEIKND